MRHLNHRKLVIAAVVASAMKLLYSLLFVCIPLVIAAVVASAMTFLLCIRKYAVVIVQYAIAIPTRAKHQNTYQTYRKTIAWL